MPKLILLMLAASAVAMIFACINYESLGVSFETAKTRLMAASKAQVNEDAIASLPSPIQRYLRASGNVGRAAVSCVSLQFQTALYRRPGTSAMTGLSYQIDCFDPPSRLFYMRTRMYGLPVAVFHYYAGSQAIMRVRLAGLRDVVNASGAEFSKTETVTLLNDICVFAPSRLAGPEFSWRAIDDSRTEVTFSNGPHVVRAVLDIDRQGRLVNFTSEDRGEMQSGGSLRLLPWSTPLADFQSHDGRLVPGFGEAVWERPEGPFTYGTFKLLSVAFDQPQAIFPER